MQAWTRSASSDRPVWVPPNEPFREIGQNRPFCPIFSKRIRPQQPRFYFPASNVGASSNLLREKVHSAQSYLLVCLVPRISSSADQYWAKASRPVWVST